MGWVFLGGAGLGFEVVHKSSAA
ncbi:hypothetical protein PMI38_04090, partial [Pseudomonas sp. GM84]